MPTPFTITERVRWGDVDLAGVIRYDAYLRFVELAEAELFRSLGYGYRDLFERFDMWLPRRVMHTDFHAPARLDDPLLVLAYFSRVGRSSLTLHVDLLSPDGATLHAAAHLVLVCVTMDAFTTRSLPDELAAAARTFEMSPEEARAAATR